MSDINMTSLAGKLQDLELCLKSHHDQEASYGRALREAILCKDLFIEVEVLKSLGDLHLQKGKRSKVSAEFDKAAGLYAAALLRCKDSAMGQTLEHRIGYMAKLSRQLLQGYTPHFRWLSSDYWGTADSNVLRVAGTCDKLDRRIKKSQHSVEDTYTETLLAAIENSDMFLELEVLKSLGDFYIERGTKSSDVSQFSKAAAMYKKALTRCGDPETKKTLHHRISYAEKTREAVRLYKDHLKKGESSLNRADLNSAEQHFAAALKAVHVPAPTAQQYQREVEPLCKLGDVYSKRGQQTGDGGDFVKAAALYNAAIASYLDDTENHKEQLKEMRDQIKLEMETIDEQLDPYVLEEDDPCVKEIETKRAQAVRQLFENIAQQRKEFISLLVEECIGLMGPPPCKYALIGLGSQATGLVTPYSDLEFAMLIDEESEKCLLYFRNLTRYLHLKVVNLGETILPAMGIKSLNDFYSENPLDNWYYDYVTPRGFAFDGSMPKASKTPLGRQGTKNKPTSELICTPENMASKVKDDVTLYLKEGYHLATILRNPCLIAGDQDLIDTTIAMTDKVMQADGGKMAQQLAQETQRENIKNFMLAISYYREALKTADGTETKDTMVLLCHIGHANFEVGDHNKAISYYEQALKMHGRIHKESKAHPETAAILSNLGAAWANLGDQRKAISFHEQALQMEKRIYSQSAANPGIAISLNNLGDAWHREGDYRKAINYHKQALEMTRRIYGGSSAHSQIALLLNNLGVNWGNLGEHKRAVSYHEQALQMYRDIYGPQTAHPDIAQSFNNLGKAWQHLGNYRKAINYYEQALQIYRSIYGQATAHPDIAMVLNNIAKAWGDLGDYGKTISYYEQALQIYRSIYGQATAHPGIAKVLNNIGGAWGDLGDYRKALSYYEQALQMMKSIYGQLTEPS
ncbi:KLC4 [Branchiostoma lanceolatum]|uniref:KLC4 protein n=1 Tax=Branchiostoma lanceolatum TaxID=7740 RepID=A0A8J9Z3X7_BRALA|nr:KLC4 [Branchiostoma lanceolatum]